MSLPLSAGYVRAGRIRFDAGYLTYSCMLSATYLRPSRAYLPMSATYTAAQAEGIRYYSTAGEIFDCRIESDRYGYASAYLTTRLCPKVGETISIYRSVNGGIWDTVFSGRASQVVERRGEIGYSVTILDPMTAGTKRYSGDVTLAGGLTAQGIISYVCGLGGVSVVYEVADSVPISKTGTASIKNALHQALGVLGAWLVYDGTTYRVTRRYVGVRSIPGDSTFSEQVEVEASGYVNKVVATYTQDSYGDDDEVTNYLALGGGSLWVRRTGDRPQQTVFTYPSPDYENHTIIETEAWAYTEDGYVASHLHQTRLITPGGGTARTQQEETYYSYASIERPGVGVGIYISGEYYVETDKYRASNPPPGLPYNPPAFMVKRNTYRSVAFSPDGRDVLCYEWAHEEKYDVDDETGLWVKTTTETPQFHTSPNTASPVDAAGLITDTWVVEVEDANAIIQLGETKTLELSGADLAISGDAAVATYVRSMLMEAAKCVSATVTLPVSLFISAGEEVRFLGSSWTVSAISHDLGNYETTLTLVRTASIAELLGSLYCEPKTSGTAILPLIHGAVVGVNNFLQGTVIDRVTRYEYMVELVNTAETILRAKYFPDGALASQGLMPGTEVLVGRGTSGSRDEYFIVSVLSASLSSGLSLHSRSILKVLPEYTHGAIRSFTVEVA